MDVLVDRAGIEADGGSGFSVPVCFVRSASEPPDCIKLSGHGHLHPEPRQVRHFVATRGESRINNDITAAVNGINSLVGGVCSDGDDRFGGDAHYLGLKLFGFDSFDGPVGSGITPDAEASGHAVSVVIVDGNAPEVRDQRRGDKLFFPEDKRFKCTRTFSKSQFKTTARDGDFLRRLFERKRRRGVRVNNWRRRDVEGNLELVPGDDVSAPGPGSIGGKREGYFEPVFGARLKLWLFEGNLQVTFSFRSQRKFRQCSLLNDVSVAGKLPTNFSEIEV